MILLVICETNTTWISCNGYLYCWSSICWSLSRVCCYSSKGLRVRNSNLFGYGPKGLIFFSPFARLWYYLLLSFMSGWFSLLWSILPLWNFQQVPASDSPDAPTTVPSLKNMHKPVVCWKKHPIACIDCLDFCRHDCKHWSLSSSALS